MKVRDCLDNMSKMYLNRVVNSFSRDIHKLSESGMRDFISRNYKEITQHGHIKAKLDFSDVSHRERNVLRTLLLFLLLQPERSVKDEELFPQFNDYLKSLTKTYKKKDIIESIPENKREIIRTVFEIILEDENITVDEERIVNGLKEKLGLTQVEFYAILHIIRNINSEFDFTNAEIDEGMKELQNRGLVYYLSKNADVKKCVIPDEITDVLIDHYEYPLTYKSFELLLGEVNKTSIQKLLKERGLSTSGSKEECIYALHERGYKPEKLLEDVNKTDLDNIAKKLDDVKVSSTKNKLIKEILRNYFYLDTSPLEKDGKLTNAKLWEYYDDYANRRYQKLRQLNLISRDLDIEHAFEELTKYAFSRLAGTKLRQTKDTNSADGITIDSNGFMIMWDNKSQESYYRFPLQHQKQFTQYIVKSKQKPSVFLVITGDVADAKDIQKKCIKLTAETGTTFAVIEASMFKKLLDGSDNSHFDLQILNHTGLIDEKTAEQRLAALS